MPTIPCCKHYSSNNVLLRAHSAIPLGASVKGVGFKAVCNLRTCILLCEADNVSVDITYLLKKLVIRKTAPPSN